MTQRSDDRRAAPIFTIGPTLARKMSRNAAAAYVNKIPLDRSVGVVGIATSRSHVPPAINVDCVIDTMSPDHAILAMRVAISALLKGYGEPDDPLIMLAPIDLDGIRSIAEHLVAHCRSSRIDDEAGRYMFDVPLESAVQAVMQALAALSITPLALRGGRDNGGQR